MWQLFLTHGLYQNEQWDNFDSRALFCVAVPILVVIGNTYCPSTMGSTLCKIIYLTFTSLIRYTVVILLPLAQDHTAMESGRIRIQIPVSLFQTLTLYFEKIFYFYLFLDRGEGSEKERERNINVWLPLTRPPSGTWPAIQACALTENRTSDPLLHRPVLNPLSHTSQG